MPESSVSILMSEYTVVNDHWMLATRQKATVLQITSGFFVALVGATFLGHLSWPQSALIAACILIILVFAYVQKEADFWAAAICIASIERAVNLLEGPGRLMYGSSGNFGMQ